MRKIDPKVKRQRANARVQRWKAENRERVNAAAKKHRLANPEKYRLKYQNRNREKEMAARRVRRAVPDTWKLDVLRDIRRRCKNKGIPYNLSAADLTIPELCPILLKPILFGQRAAHPQSPSVDRIKPWLGYVKGNVRVISYRANTMKSDCVDPEVFRRLANYIEGGN